MHPHHWIFQYLPTEPQFAKVNNLPPPALSCTREIDAGRVEFRGAQGRRLWRTSTQWDQQVPRSTEVSGELKAHRVGGGALSCAAHINLKTRKHKQHQHR